ncbi:MAG: hypothetical protein H0X33_08245 [Taibaiella sp.]|nr:hypothetical protein [Taibaiella sp.]
MKTLKIILAFFLFIAIHACYGQQVVKSKAYRYKINLPQSLKKASDSAGSAEEQAFYDDDAGIVFLISVKDGLYTDLNGYRNCSVSDMENKLRTYENDSTLKLVSCGKSRYYTAKAVVLHFETSVLPSGLDRCIIYFVHHHNKELQLSFMYSKTDEKNSMAYIDSIMQKLELL